MKVGATTSVVLLTEGFRLDACYHANEGSKAFNQLQRWEGANTCSKRLDTIGSVCLPDGIFIGGRSKRIYVYDSEHGIPFLSSSNMLLASMDNIKLISKKQPELESMLLHPGWTLISRSGTIGNTTYVRSDMEGLAGSEHIMRVIADPLKIPSGYLYTFLSSAIGVAMIRQGTFGAVIDTIEPKYIASLPIPRLDSTQEERIHHLIEESSRMWSEAVVSLQNARLYFSYLQTSEILGYQPHDNDISVVNCSQLNGRLGAHYHSKLYRDLENTILSENHISLRDACQEIYAPPPFKHIYLSKPNKYPFLTGGELRDRRVLDVRYLSPLGMKNINDYVVRKNWIALFKSGSLDSMFASVFLITDDLDRFCLSDHVIRLIVASEEITPEYIYAFLSTWAGRLLIVRRATGMAVPFVREESVSSIPIPILEKKCVQEITSLIGKAFAFRKQSLELENTAQKLLTEALSA